MLFSFSTSWFLVELRYYYQFDYMVNLFLELPYRRRRLVGEFLRHWVGIRHDFAPSQKLLERIRRPVSREYETLELPLPERFIEQAERVVAALLKASGILARKRVLRIRPNPLILKVDHGPLPSLRRLIIVDGQSASLETLHLLREWVERAPRVSHVEVEQLNLEFYQKIASDPELFELFGRPCAFAAERITRAEKLLALFKSSDLDLIEQGIELALSLEVEGDEMARVFAPLLHDSHVDTLSPGPSILHLVNRPALSFAERGRFASRILIALIRVTGAWRRLKQLYFNPMQSLDVLRPLLEERSGASHLILSHFCSDLSRSTPPSTQRARAISELSLINLDTQALSALKRRPRLCERVQTLSLYGESAERLPDLPSFNSLKTLSLDGARLTDPSDLNSWITHQAQLSSLRLKSISPRYLLELERYPTLLELIKQGALSSQPHPRRRAATRRVLREASKLMGDQHKIQSKEVLLEIGERLLSRFDYKVAGETFTMCYCPAGESWMGARGAEGKSPSGPQHLIRISRPFLISQTTVTRALWRSVMAPLKRYLRHARVTSKTATLPMEKVSWIMAVEFCNALSERARLSPAYVVSGEHRELKVTRDSKANGFRLPTEAEWEYAARAGSAHPDLLYAGSGDLDQVGWYKGNAPKRTPKVKQKRPNEWGIFDLSGGVYERCQDKWARRHYALCSSVSVDPIVYSPSAKQYLNYVIRGGDYQSSSQECMISHREMSHVGCGLRLVLPLD